MRSELYRESEKDAADMGNSPLAENGAIWYSCLRIGITFDTGDLILKWRSFS